MAAITAAMVKELRERTGLGMMDCKKALSENDGDIEKAIEHLRKSSGMKAAKKASRTAADGIVAVAANDSGDYATMVEVNSETDFVARDDNFQAFVQAVSAQTLADKQTDVTALMAGGLEAQREALVQKVGENINVRRVAAMSVGSGVVASYVHGNHRIGVLVSVEGGDMELGKDIAMHIAAVNPMVVSPDNVPEDTIAKEREIYAAQAAESGKPPEIVEKMIDGRIRKYLAEISLVEQPFVKDPDTKVAALLKQAGATVTGFVRYEVGEGIEKEEDDFAEEVRKQAGL